MSDKGGQEPTRLELEVRFDAEPIAGRVWEGEDGDRVDRPFSGWLGLISAIEAAGGRPQEGVEAR